MARERSIRDRRGPNRPGGGLPNRPGGRADEMHALRDRAHIAQVAARLIVEHGITDWSLAKRKALRQLMLPESSALPSNDDLVQALTEHQALFGGDAHVASLRRQRKSALEWMRRLDAFAPVLVGGVAAGWATEHSEVRVELVADDPKTVEIALASAGVVYTVVPTSDDAEKSGATQLRVQAADATLRLLIFTPQQRRNRPRRDDEPRLAAAAVAALLAA